MLVPKEQVQGEVISRLTKHPWGGGGQESGLVPPGIMFLERKEDPPSTNTLVELKENFGSSAQ